KFHSVAALLTRVATVGFHAFRATKTQRRNPIVATDLSIALQELLDKAGADMDFLREAVRLLAQHLMELEVSRQIGAERHERTPERVTHRNGYRPRLWDTRVGTIELRVPKLRQGSYFGRVPSSVETAVPFENRLVCELRRREPGLPQSQTASRPAWPSTACSDTAAAPATRPPAPAGRRRSAVGLPLRWERCRPHRHAGQSPASGAPAGLWSGSSASVSGPR